MNQIYIVLWCNNMYLFLFILYLSKISLCWFPNLLIILLFRQNIHLYLQEQLDGKVINNQSMVVYQGALIIGIFFVCNSHQNQKYCDPWLYPDFQSLAIWNNSLTFVIHTNKNKHHNPNCFLFLPILMLLSFLFFSCQ